MKRPQLTVMSIDSTLTLSASSVCLDACKQQCVHFFSWWKALSEYNKTSIFLNIFAFFTITGFVSFFYYQGRQNRTKKHI